MFFHGEYRHSLDKKGRVVLPSRFRSEFMDGFMMTKGLERCVFVFTKDGWQKFLDKSEASPTMEEARSFDRVLIGGAHSDTPDKQGRVGIPSYLRDYAKLDKEVVVVGLKDRLEIWNKENWEEYISLAEEKYAESAKSLKPENSGLQ